MRKITFAIDDYNYFKNLFYNRFPESPKEDIEKALAGLNSCFKATFILTGDKFPDQYKLFDENGEKMNINDLNGYQKGIVINDCYRYFEGKIKEPCGVVKIKDENL